jgi:hypothetical protein
MMRRRGRIFILLALATAIGVALFAAMAVGARGPASAHAATPTHAAVQHAAIATTPKDGDTAQTGNQTGPDRAGTPAESGSASDPAGTSQASGPDTGTSSGETSPESEQGQPGEPAGGHADPAGSTGGDCTGNCVQ